MHKVGESRIDIGPDRTGRTKNGWHSLDGELSDTGVGRSNRTSKGKSRPDNKLGSLKGTEVGKQLGSVGQVVWQIYAREAC
jgi:hypothetical protein